LPGLSTTADVLDVVRSRLTETIGSENLLGVSIDLDTSFDEDLEMDSIEFVALMERLSEDYGEGLDIVDWLSGLEFEEIVELKVGDLVTFIRSSVG
jgi:acyl carrier protein